MPKIIDHMNEMPYVDSLGREYKYGSTFPLDMNAFAYNETIAQELFPISREEAEKHGYKWVEPEPKKHTVTLEGKNVPDSILEIDERILKEVIGCAHEGKCAHQCTGAFKITQRELDFYKRFGAPIPQLCPNCRHFERLAIRNPIKLWKRQCMCDKNHSHHTGKCTNEFETSYASDRKEIVYCEQCYNSEVA